MASREIQILAALEPGFVFIKLSSWHLTHRSAANRKKRREKGTRKGDKSDESTKGFGRSETLNDFLMQTCRMSPQIFLDVLLSVFLPPLCRCSRGQKRLDGKFNLEKPQVDVKGEQAKVPKLEGSEK
jgi:hypothetical protein